MRKRRALVVLLLIFLSLVFSCTSTDLIVDEIEVFYVKDVSDPSIILNLSFHSNSENDELLVTLTSPDGLLSWESIAVKATDGVKHYFTIPDIILPYYIEGEWSLRVSRSDKDVNLKVQINAPTETDVRVPDWFNQTTVLRVNGGVYTISSPNIRYDENVTIVCYNSSRKETEIVGNMYGEKEKRITIPFRPSNLVFVTKYSENILLRKKGMN